MSVRKEVESDESDVIMGWPAPHATIVGDRGWFEREERFDVSLVITIFLFHFRSALIPILTMAIAVVASFIPMYYLKVSSKIVSLGGLALAIGVLVDAAIVMVENGYRHLSEAQHSGKGDKLGPRSISSPERRRILLDAAKAGRTRALLLALDYRRLVPSGLPARSPGRTDVPAPGLDQDFGYRLFVTACHHAGAAVDASVTFGLSSASCASRDNATQIAKLSRQALVNTSRLFDRRV